MAKLATKTPPESGDGGAESAVDSDLKSQADESTAGEANNLNSLWNMMPNIHRENKRKMVVKAQAREFWNKLKPKCRDWFRECAQEEQKAFSQATLVGVMLMSLGPLRDGYSSLGRRPKCTTGLIAQVFTMERQKLR